MENFLPKTFIEFLNQTCSEDFQKYWEGTDEEFWALVAKTYNLGKSKSKASKEQVMSNVTKNYKRVTVKINRRHVNDIYILPDTNSMDIFRYACQQIPMTTEDFWLEKNSDFKTNIGGFDKWTQDDSSFVALKFGEKMSPKVKSGDEKWDSLERPDISEAEAKKKVIKKFGKVSEPQNLTWVDLLERMTVAQNPKSTIELGAMVDVLPRKPEKLQAKVHYGYITSMVCNSNKRPLKLEIQPFEDSAQPEVWIWRGVANRGAWFAESELEKLEKSGETVRSLPWKGLKVNEDVLDLKF